MAKKKQVYVQVHEKRSVKYFQVHSKGIEEGEPVMRWRWIYTTSFRLRHNFFIA